MTSYLSRIGERYGRLLVAADAGRRDGRSFLLCRCDCGTEKPVAAADLVKGSANSCGCLRREMKTKHNRNRTPEHCAWQSIKTRCNNPNRKQFKDYGGRGIKIADEWADDFVAFLDHVGPRPSPAHSIDRIDNERGYEPGNVRWATRVEQGQNTRSRVMMTHNGQTAHISEWAEKVGIRRKTIAVRLTRYGWSVERALTVPIYKGRSVGNL